MESLLVLLNDMDIHADTLPTVTSCRTEGDGMDSLLKPSIQTLNVHQEMGLI